MLLLARCYIDGDGVEPNPLIGRQLLEKVRG
jgi:hypothetical protein